MDDERFAASFARSRMAYHGLGRHRIRAALRQRGVTREAAEEGLKQAIEEHPEQQTVDALARRLLARKSKDDSKKRLLKTYAALLRRGFPASLVRERLAVLRKDTGDILDGYQFDESGPEGDGESEDG